MRHSSVFPSWNRWGRVRWGSCTSLVSLLVSNLSQSLNIKWAEGILYPRVNTNRWKDHFQVSFICIRSLLSLGRKLTHVHLEKEENVSLLYYLLHKHSSCWCRSLPSIQKKSTRSQSQPLQRERCKDSCGWHAPNNYSNRRIMCKNIWSNYFLLQWSGALWLEENEISTQDQIICPPIPDACLWL